MVCVYGLKPARITTGRSGLLFEVIFPAKMQHQERNIKQKKPSV
ncbi:hypothetical protein NIASO_08920 [Niabella soli DSM 19437]|uniref:Uncharacterized protein n=1 Tax=Niabella soli DSM 19437 TaxID=929713 RepID=W0F7R8_9BACT|nr:hypothetical protein NIASO_08920 [Niabella soli DSM 19437]